ncbi:MAG TPA: DUF305 domain-containing protein, partial [Thermomicrobiales bacterium]|nr:DUF305 domain-containing protein [Thermomicrobiales bacterium]
MSSSVFGRSWRWLAALLVLLIVGALGLLVMSTRPPDGDSPEAGMLRDMLPHHTQAVEMALIIRDRTEDEQLRALATDIILSQQNQIGMMEGWLDLWDVSPNLQGPMMSWMDHPVEAGELMPGMATAEQVESLRMSPVDEAEVAFLQLMIRHHQGAVHMADAYLERGDQEEVSEFARNIIAVQDREIET